MSFLKHAARLFFPLMSVVFFSTAAMADKAAVAIFAPETVKKGAEIVIRIKVTHNGNNMVHHVDWARISVNDKEIGRWDYSWTNLPESDSFEREVKYVAVAPFEVSAQADCNLHGSAGVVKKQISVKE